MTHRFDFIFTSPKHSDRPFNATAIIYLKTYLNDENSDILISPTLHSTEYEEYIDTLISELQEIKTKLHRKFK